jgi:hypothetical protein
MGSAPLPPKDALHRRLIHSPGAALPESFFEVMAAHINEKYWHTERKHDDRCENQKDRVAAETVQERDADADPVTNADVKRYGAQRGNEIQHQESFERHAGRPGKKGRHPGGRPQKTRQEYRPVAVFGHEFPSAVIRVVEYAPVVERSLRARSITFADVKLQMSPRYPPAMHTARVTQIERKPAALKMPPA